MGFVVGTATGAGSGVTARHVVVIYEETNSTWDHGILGGIVRNTTDTGFYEYNITVGDNFIRLPVSYTFGNLSLSLLNTSFNWDTGASVISGYSFGSILSKTPGNVTNSGSDPPDATAGGVEYNLTEFWFSVYNNTGVTWEPYYVYNQTSENNTVLTIPGPHEVVWIHSDEDNLTWNGTNIIGNWTI